MQVIQRKKGVKGAVGTGRVQQSPRDLLPYTFGDLRPFVREWISGILFEAHGVLFGQHRLREKLIWLKVKLQCKALQQQSKADISHICKSIQGVLMPHWALSLCLVVLQCFICFI